MSSIDNRVVEMEFDNQQFERGVSTTIKSLDNLKKGLKNLNGSSKALDEVGASAKNIKLDELASNVQTISSRFSTLGVIATTTLANIATSAVNAGARLLKSFSLDPITQGFSEYELQLNSIQTILANTRSKGTNLDQVNAALNELNTYADKTIYNFAQMTENIGRFTAAGVDLDKSVSSIKGISNLAALSGSTPAQAASAMYQLSQAIAAGKIQLMDWNSVVNAGMGGEQFQEALKRTARNFGINVDGMIETYGSFRESLTKGEWLTADILTETLKQISGAYSESDLIAQGYTEDQAKAIVELAQSAEESATKIRTFTQLVDTAMESLGSGWAQTWQILFGDFEESTELWSTIGDAVTGAIGKMSDARNNLLQGWKDLGGRTDVIDGLKAAFEGLSSIVTTVGDAFRRVFPPTTAQQLKDLSSGFKDLMENLKPSEATLERIGRVAEGFFSVLDLGKQSVEAILAPIGRLLGSEGFAGLIDTLLEAAASVGDFFTNIDKAAKEGDVFGGISDSLSNVADRISITITKITSSFEGFGSIFGTISDKVIGVAELIYDKLKTVFTWIKNNVTLDDVFKGLNVAAIVTIAESLKGAFDKIKDAIDGLLGGDEDTGLRALADTFSDTMESVHDTLTEFQMGIKVASLVGIAAAIAVLAGALDKISKIKATSLAKGLTGIAVMFKELTVAFSDVVKTVAKYDTDGVVKAAASMVIMAEAMNLLADAVGKFGSLSLEQLANGLVGAGVGLAALVKAVKSITKVDISLKTSVAILALAEACDILADSVKKFSKLDWDELARGLVGIGGALWELTIPLSVLSSVGGGGALLGGGAFFVTIQALDEISENLKKISELSWDDIDRGFNAMGGAFTTLTAALAVLSNVGGFGALLGGGAIFTATQALDEISEMLKDVSDLDWDDIDRGFNAMGGALTTLTAALAVLSNVGGFGALLGGGAIFTAAQALDEISENLKKISELSWEEIGRGLGAMGGALTELSIATGALGGLTGIFGLYGASSIFVTVQSLGQIATALKQLSSMTWDEIQRGLVGMGGALTEIGVVSGLLGNLTGIAGLVGAGTITLAATGLQQLYDGFSQFATMSWEEIGTGLVAMGGALGELSVITGATGALTGIAGLVGAGTITLASQGLTQLAEAFMKFASMDWESVKSGLVAMGAAMGETALGGLLNTFSGFGAGAIATIAEPLGQLADSVKKWQGVSVPEGLGAQLGSLAGGIQAFTFGGFGAGAIATVAEPLGQLASSVGKWSSVTVPEGLGEKLSDLAGGINAFTFSFIAGGSIATVIDPLKNLAGAVNEWKNVTVPEDLGSTLEDLAAGVNSFVFSGFTSGGANAAAEPLKNLAGAVKAWNGVSIPDGIAQTLEDFSTGLRNFSDLGQAPSVIQAVGMALSTLAQAGAAMAGVDILSIGTNLQTFTTSISTLPTQLTTSISGIREAFYQLTLAVVTSLSALPAQITSASTGISAALSSIAVTISASSVLINTALSMLMTAGIASVNAQAASLAAAGTNATTQFSAAFTTGIAAATVSALASLTVMSASVVATATVLFAVASNSFRMFGVNIGRSLIEGMRSTQGDVSNEAKELSNRAAIGARSGREGFINAGEYIASGLAIGIRRGGSSAINAAAQVAANALRAAKAALGEHSPSKEFAKVGMYADMGFQKGFEQYGGLVEKSAVAVADKSLSAVQLAMQNADDPIGANLSAPTIAPVIDYSSADVRALDGKRQLSLKSDLNLGAFKDSSTSLMQTMMQEQQATRESNQRVIDEISGLREDLSNFMNADPSEIGLYVDGRKLASSLAAPMNRQLNILSKRGGLG